MYKNFENRDRKSDASLLIFLGWIMYMISYLGKVNYSANITQIIDYYQVTKSEAGMVPTFFFFSYGIGIGKQYNALQFTSSKATTFSLFAFGCSNFIIPNYC